MWPRGCPTVPIFPGAFLHLGGVGQDPERPVPPPQTCPRLEGLRGRAPGCTWDSLRNSAGEKLGQLRSRGGAPAPGGACALLQELSEEQSFAISYLDIGERQTPLGPAPGTPQSPSPASGCCGAWG